MTNTSSKIPKHITRFKRSLPIYKYKQDFISLFDNNDSIVVIGETGCGKSTQVPQYIPSNLRICITQPRRVAAVSLAKRVAYEMGVQLGEEVGYSVRFEELSSDKTRIKFVTDGMLLREMMLDPMLNRYDVVIIDEAHERSIASEILMGLIKNLYKLKKRKSPIKTIIMSATIHAESFISFFNSAVFEVEGRMFPVDIYYTPTPEDDYVSAMVIAVVQAHLDEEKGDVLCFLPGQDDIESVVTGLRAKNEVIVKHNIEQPEDMIDELLVCPLYAALPPEEQNKVFETTPKDKRKIIIATNIAETSLTIPGVRFVIDSGLCKQRIFHPNTGIDILKTKPVSKASLTQRKGRAGREGVGKCFRLFQEDVVKTLEEVEVPEIERSDLCSVVLSLLVIGVDISQLELLSSIDPQTINEALAVLDVMGAVKRVRKGTTWTGKLLDQGKLMATFPVNVYLSRALLFAAERNVLKEVVAIISLMSAEHLILETQDGISTRNRFIDVSGDHCMLLKLYRQFVTECKLKFRANVATRKQELTPNAEKRAKAWCYRNSISWKGLSHSLQVYHQLIKYCIDSNLVKSADQGHNYTAEVENIEIRKSLLAGYFLKVAQLALDQKTYTTFGKGQEASIHPTSVLLTKGRTRPQWILFSELVLTSKVYMRFVSELEEAWLPEVVPSYFVNAD
ncbi:hypothetical protein P9112_013149 [Eukaryota sp. TZLM1-RC]